jgi:hypothetical protein
MAQETTDLRYSKVSRRMWGDAKFMALTPPRPNAQTLWLRLLTGPELGPIPGLFRAWEAGLAQALGWPLEAFREAFGEVSAKGLAKADWRTGLVWVPNAVEHNVPESPNVVRSWRKEWDELPDSNLKSEAYSRLKAFLEGLAKGYAKAFGEACRQPSPNQEQEQEQEIEREEPPKPRAKREKKTECELPPDWSPTAAHVAKAKEAGLDLDREAEKFKLHAETHARKAASWNGAFSTWLLRAEEFSGRVGGAPGTPPPTQTAPRLLPGFQAPEDRDE